MNKIFILEDCPERIKWFKKTFSNCDLFITANVNDAFNKLNNEKFDMIFLDRDLSNSHFNGEDLAWRMKENKLASYTPIIIHSENKRGQRVMPRYLNSYHKNVKVIPFYLLKRQSTNEILGNKKEAEIKQTNESFMDTFLQMQGQSLESLQKTQAAEALFRLWSNKGNKISQTRYRKPSNISTNEVDCMCKEGLIKTIGNNLEITNIGSEVIKIMILGDNRCALEKDYDTPINFWIQAIVRVAQANINKKKGENRYEKSWWNRFMK